MDFSPEERVTIPLDACERCGVCRHVWHELCQVLDKSNKSLYLVQVARLPPLAYPRHFICVCVDTMLIDHVPEAIKLFCVQVAFFTLKIEFRLR